MRFASSKKVLDKSHYITGTNIINALREDRNSQAGALNSPPEVTFSHCLRGGGLRGVDKVSPFSKMSSQVRSYSGRSYSGTSGTIIPGSFQDTV